MTAPAPHLSSALASLLAQWQRSSPAHRAQLICEAVAQTPGSHMTFPDQIGARRGWIIHLHGITGTGSTSAAAMADWAAGAVQAIARQTPRPFRNHGEEIAHTIRTARA